MHLLKHSVVAIVVAVVSLPMGTESSHARPAGQALSSACSAYAAGGLLGDLLPMLQDSATELGFQQPVESIDISVGSFTRVYRMIEGFVDGSVVGMSGLEPSDNWAAPILQYGGPVEVLRVYEPSPGVCTIAMIGEGQTLAQNLGSMPSGAIALFEFPEDAWYLLDGTTLTALDDDALATIPTSMSLSAFQDLIVDRYAADLQYPEGTDLTGGTSSARSFRSWDGGHKPLVLVVLLTSVLLVVVVHRRGRPAA